MGTGAVAKIFPSALFLRPQAGPPPFFAMQSTFERADGTGEGGVRVSDCLSNGNSAVFFQQNFHCGTFSGTNIESIFIRLCILM